MFLASGNVASFEDKVDGEDDALNVGGSFGKRLESSNVLGI